MGSRAQDLKEQGNKAFEEGRNEDAIRLYSQAIGLGANAVLYSNRAAAYLKLARYEDALKDATAAIRLDPSYVKAYVRKGNALMGLDKYGEARTALLEGLEVDPTSALLREKLTEFAAADQSKAVDLACSAALQPEEFTFPLARGASAVNPWALMTKSFLFCWSQELTELVAAARGEPHVPGQCSDPGKAARIISRSLLAILKAHADTEGRIKCASAMVMGFWGELTRHPSLMSVTTETLQSSKVVETMLGFLKAVCLLSKAVKDEVAKGGRILAYTISRAFTKVPITGPDMDTRLVSLIEHFAERCIKELKMRDPWGVREDYSTPHPMLAAVLFGTPAVVSLVASKGVPLNPSKAALEELPLSTAFRRGREDNFARLLELGAEVDIKTFRGFTLSLQWPSEFASQDLVAYEDCKHKRPAELRASRIAMVKVLLEKRPRLLTTPLRTGDGTSFDLFALAIHAGDADLVEVVHDAGGGKPRFRYPSTLDVAITGGSYEVVKLLVEKYKVAESNSQYDDATVRLLSDAVAMMGVRSYPLNPKFDGPHALTTQERTPECSRILDVILRSGLNAPWDAQKQNTLLSKLYSGEKHGMLSEAHTIDLLERYRRAGWNITSTFEKHAKAGANGGGSALVVMAASKGQQAVVDYAIEKAGCSVDGVFVRPDGGREPALVIALQAGDAAMAVRLLTRHKAKAAYPGARLKEQPVYALIDKSRLPDAEAAKILRLMLANSPDLLELDCYREKGVPGTSTGTVKWTPIFACCSPAKPLCLEVLLTSGPQAKEMARQVITAEDEITRLVEQTALQLSVEWGSWECASLLLKHANPPVTQQLAFERSAIGHQFLRDSPLQTVKAAAASRTNRPPRALVVAFESAAALENAVASDLRAAAAMDRRAGNTSSGSGEGGFSFASALTSLLGQFGISPPIMARHSASGEGLTTNAFEIPLEYEDGYDSSEAEAEAQGKKQGSKNKKKKKGKKKGKKGKKSKSASAAAPSGAGGSGEAGSSDEEEDDFEEPDDNLVDSRYAPSLDVMLAERERERQAREADSKPSKK